MEEDKDSIACGKVEGQTKSFSGLGIYAFVVGLKKSVILGLVLLSGMDSTEV